jgi:RimJ/RimL family protein N-acetyltransferase
MTASGAIHARVAADNAGSLRVLEKIGFRRVAMERAFAAGRGEDIQEVILRKDGAPDHPIDKA